MPGTAVGRDRRTASSPTVRTLSTAIADGRCRPRARLRAAPILRRAVRYGRQMLGTDEGFFAALSQARSRRSRGRSRSCSSSRSSCSVAVEEEAAFS